MHREEVSASETVGRDTAVDSDRTLIKRWCGDPNSLPPDRLWPAARRVGTPFVHAVDPGFAPSQSGAQQQVTLLYDASADVDGLYLKINRVTDKDRVREGLMEPLPGGRGWHKTLTLPDDLRASYGFVELPAGQQIDLTTLGGRFSPLTALPDPNNHSAPLRLQGGALSVLALDRAPGQPEWVEPSSLDPERHLTRYLPGDPPRPVWQYLPIEAPQGVVMVFDGEVWHQLGLAGAMDHAVAAGRVPPLLLLGVQNLSRDDRLQVLGGPGRGRLLGQLSELLVGLHREFPHAAQPARTTIAGQSLGGLTALLAGAHGERFGAVVADSPSMWWRPDHISRPDQFQADDAAWVSEQLLAGPSRPRLGLGVGSFEGAMTQHVRALTTRAAAAGFEVHGTVYQGGHDWAWWRGALFDHLAVLYG